MGDAVLGGCCGFIAESIQMTYCDRHTPGANGCRCCNACRCGCGWNAGEFNPDDLPEEAKAARAAKLKNAGGATYPPAAPMEVPAHTPAAGPTNTQ